MGLVAAVAGSTAVAVHHLDQTEIKLAATEIKRIHDKAATEIKRIHDKAATDVARVEGEWKSEVARVEGERKSEVARVEGERRLSEERLRAEVERYKYDLQLRHTQDYKPYQAAKEQANKETGGTGGPQKEEETD